uniref:29 kDa salivary protein SP08 n=1 Tax=Phlebotomus perniciosus TaxID=13204 RepID=Q0ZS55_PHLPE|nr:29 kDa salivary protein SP08 [Phlebotomus perniciosus]
MIVKGLLGVFLVILLVCVTEQGVDGYHRANGDYGYSYENRHHVVNGDEEEHEIKHTNSRKFDDDDYLFSHGYAAYDDEDDEDERQGYSRGGGGAGDSSRDPGFYRRGSQEQSYDPHSGQTAPGYSESSEYEHSGDYDNSQNQQYSSTPSNANVNLIDQYLHLIQLHSIPSDLVQYAESYLTHAKNSIRYYAVHAKDFERIRPCLESVTKYFNMLNDDLAREYVRCQRQCYLDRLNSYTTAISQYTVTTNACINNRLN